MGLAFLGNVNGQKSPIPAAQNAGNNSQLAFAPAAAPVQYGDPRGGIATLGQVTGYNGNSNINGAIGHSGGAPVFGTAQAANNYQQSLANNRAQIAQMGAQEDAAKAAAAYQAQTDQAAQNNIRQIQGSHYSAPQASGRAMGQVSDATGGNGQAQNQAATSQAAAAQNIQPNTAFGSVLSSIGGQMQPLSRTLQGAL